MNVILKGWLLCGSIAAIMTVMSYFLLQGSGFVWLCVFPTIMVLGIWIPIQRVAKKIGKVCDEQGGKCYNCNLKIVDKNTMVLEDDTGHVYCSACHKMLFGHLYYESGGIWYRKDDKQPNRKGVN